MSKVAVFLIGLLAVSSAGALVDPTKPVTYSPPVLSESRFHLSSILLGGKRKVAVINGKAVSEGETLGKARVVKIDKDNVLLNAGGKKIQLVLERTLVKRER